MKRKYNNFCLGQVIFDTVDKTVVIYGGSIYNNLTKVTTDLFFIEGGGYIRETDDKNNYKPFKDRNNKIFKGHMAKILELEEAYTGVFKHDYFDKYIIGLINHTIRFIDTVKESDIKSDHIKLNRLPGDIND